MSESPKFSEETIQRRWSSAKAVIYAVLFLIFASVVMMVSRLDPENYVANILIWSGLAGSFISWIIFLIRGIKFINSARGDDRVRKS